MSEPCPRTDLPPEMCSHCRGLDLPETLDDHRSDLSPITWRGTAKFESRCLTCRDDIYVGDPIARTEAGNYVCGDCGES